VFAENIAIGATPSLEQAPKPWLCITAFRRVCSEPLIADRRGDPFLEVRRELRAWSEGIAGIASLT
jgi:hypothetical protein